MKITDLENHPAADCFPMLDGEGFAAFKADIDKNGQIDPITLDEFDRVLDGRNRLRACLELKLEVDYEVYDGDDPVGFVVSRNLQRRHLDVGQRAVAADRLARLSKGRPTKKSKESEASEENASEEAFSQPEAADLMNVSRASVQRVAALREAGREDLYDAVGRGDMTPAFAAREMKKDEAAERIKNEPKPLPEGPFRVIVADPPWRYDKRRGDRSSRGKAKDQYPDMAQRELLELPIDELGHDDGCVLWLWTTNSHLPDAFKLVEHWGFVHKTVLTWVKSKMGMGDWLRGKTEHCVLAVKGKPTVTLTNQTTVLEADVREHSRKPDEFYELVEELCPGSKVELFAREPREGWSSWGAESDKFAA